MLMINPNLKIQSQQALLNYEITPGHKIAAFENKFLLAEENVNQKEALNYDLWLCQSKH